MIWCICLNEPDDYSLSASSLEPSEIVIIDSMVLGGRLGTYHLLELEHVEDTTFNRHNITLGKLGDLFPYPGYVLGIQP